MDDDLGSCLRAWRDRLTPAEAGLPVNARRRAPGLRRQEVAALAGLSVEYLARLEQGRAQRPSAAVLAPLARALRLSTAERDHLLRLAGHAPGAGSALPHLTPSLQRIMDRLADTPVHVVDDTWTVVHANALAEALLGDAFLAPGTSAARVMFGGSTGWIADEDDHHETFRAQIVADLRAAAAESPQRERVRALVEELRASSPDFAARWARADVGRVRAGRKVIVHPSVGRVEVDCDVLRADDSTLRLVVYTAAAGTSSAGALALLRATGTALTAGSHHFDDEPAELAEHDRRGDGG